ncbi:MAG: 4Fe-4S binding protein [Candidatus Bathyarchaeia archaeon]|jgi:polyferredoxin
MDWEIIGDILRIAVLAGLGVAGILAILIWKRNLATRVTYLRLVIQAVSFAALFYVFSYSIPLLYVLIIIFAMTIVLGRLYCGWFCPFGFVMDLIILLRKAFKIRYRSLPDKLNKILHQSRYVILLFFLFLPVILWLIQPPPDFNFAVVMAQLLAGPFRPYSVLLDPMIPLVVPWTGPLVVSQINLSYPYVQDIIAFAGLNIGQVIAIAFVGLTLVGSFFVRRVWCRFCPTGASLAVVNRFKGFKWAPLLHIEKDEEKCTKCGVCKRVCQSQVNDVYEQKGGKINTSMCMLCLRCTEMCPYEDTLKVKLGNKTLFKSRNWLEPSTSE